MIPASHRSGHKKASGLAGGFFLQIIPTQDREFYHSFFALYLVYIFSFFTAKAG